MVAAWNSCSFKALILGVVEGLTEFLPVSSTGHLILVGDLLDFNDDKGKIFEIVIQTGAMLAIVWEYRAKFMPWSTGLARDRDAQRFVVNLAVAFLPAAVLGPCIRQLHQGSRCSSRCRSRSHSSSAASSFCGRSVASTAIAVQSVDDMRWTDALKIGCAQAFALIPGTSRSGATIIGGLLFGLSRRAATEFSFFLAVPTLIAAGATISTRIARCSTPTTSECWRSAWWRRSSRRFSAYAGCCAIIASHDFTVFAWYRIAFGVVVLATAYSGVVSWART